MKRRLIFFGCIGIFCLISIAAMGYRLEEKGKINILKAGTLSKEMIPSIDKAISVKDQTSYGIPIEDMEKKLSYMYRYEDMLFSIGKMQFDVLGELPKGEAIPIHFYLEKEENRILFLPDELVNSETGEQKPYHLYEEKKEYYYFTFGNRFISEEGIPVVSPDSGMGSSIQLFRSKELDSVVYLGKAEVDLIKGEIDLIPVEMENNEYIDALIHEVSRVLEESGYYGTYELYIESFGRINARYDDYTQAKITAVLKGEGIEQYIYATLSEGGNGIECRFPFLSFTRNPTENFFTTSGYFMVSGYQTTIEDLFDSGSTMGRGSVIFEVSPETGEDDLLIEAQPDKGTVYDHRRMGLEEALEYIEYACSYAEWFGMYELGYREGSVRSWDKTEVAVYATKEKILIIPTEQTEDYTFKASGEERVYPLAEAEQYGKEYFQFYYLRMNPYAVNNGQLKSTLVTNDWNSVTSEMFYLEGIMDDLNTGEMEYLGKGKLNICEFADLEPEPIERDEYIIALEEQIKSMLKAEGITGEYILWLGEYEVFSQNQVCLSAALRGEKEYYLRFFLYQSKSGHFYFWPIGFGVDGSLRECEAKAYYMNRICIDRTVELKRYTSIIHF